MDHKLKNPYETHNVYIHEDTGKAYPDYLQKRMPTGEGIKDPTLVPKWTPLTAPITSSHYEPAPLPYKTTCDGFADQYSVLKDQMVARKAIALDENARKKKILRQRDLEYSREVNHQRMVEASNEIRELKTAANHIQAQMVNQDYMLAKERKKLNERLDELVSGAQFRSGDEVFKVGMHDAEGLMRKHQHDLKEAYDKQLAEKEKQRQKEFLQLEEERAHMEKLTKEEAQKRWETAQKRQLEKQEWHKVIQHFQEERNATLAKQAEMQRREDERIASFNAAQQGRADQQKAMREQRDKIAEELRERLVAEIDAKEKEGKEREIILEELLQAEADEKEFERKKELKVKRLTEQLEMKDAVRESENSKQIREEKKLRDWAEYQAVLRAQAELADQKSKRDKELRHARGMEVANRQAEQRASKVHRIAEEKKKQYEWLVKEQHDSILWKEFVDIEREKFLRQKMPELKGYLEGIHRFPHKKDDRLAAEIIRRGNDPNASSVYEAGQPLAAMKPTPGSHYDPYRNLHDARLHEIYGIGSR
ncbi:hypothetical protein RvY_07617 [Ramazzottius varieornatus]|uniref:Meiosis-specific nuclear structural protein 1 n=1 Tax=Ramazzottius varieornatus TaxID=947166 RepID=A0A1D1V2V0_RAMVA|nr:hypothetical protein RvY_07617 [Ramazzottius varieornatus]